MFTKDEIFDRFDWKKAYDSVLAQLKVVKAENTELKKKLKTVPAKGTTVRDKKTGQMGYSKGETCGMSGCLPVYILNGDGYTHHFEDWEEIEVKVK